MIHSLNPLSFNHSLPSFSLSLSLRDSCIRELRARHHTRRRHERHVLEAAHSLRVRLQELRLTPLLSLPYRQHRLQILLLLHLRGRRRLALEPRKACRSKGTRPASAASDCTERTRGGPASLRRCGKRGFQNRFGGAPLRPRPLLRRKVSTL